MAIRDAILEQLFLRFIATELLPGTGDEDEDKPLTFSRCLFTDFRSVMDLAANPVHHARSKHLDIRLHKMREETNAGRIELLYRFTNQQVADGMIKMISAYAWQRLIQGINLADAEQIAPLRH